MLNLFPSFHLICKKNVPIVIYKKAITDVFKIFRNLQNIQNVFYARITELIPF